MDVLVEVHEPPADVNVDSIMVREMASVENHVGDSSHHGTKNLNENACLQDTNGTGDVNGRSAHLCSEKEAKTSTGNLVSLHKRNEDGNTVNSFSSSHTENQCDDDNGSVTEVEINRKSTSSAETTTDYSSESESCKSSGSSPSRSVLKTRKKKPPNLKLSPQMSARALLLHNAGDQSPSSHRDDANDDSLDAGPSPLSLIKMKKREMKTLQAGVNSPIVKRSSRLEEILEIPDVKAALVKDEGYEMMRRRSFDGKPGKMGFKSCSDRQQTPGRCVDDDEFVFESNTSNVDVDSESISESDTSSVLSNLESSSLQSGLDASNDGERYRPRIAMLRNLKKVSNPYDLIADSTGPSMAFSSPTDRGDQSSIPSPSRSEKKHKQRSKSNEQDESSPKSTTKSKALLSRFRFSSLSRSNSYSSLEGWDSLSRALARVGASPLPLTSVDSFELNPKLSPILKRRSQPIRWSSDSNNIPSPLQEPGAKPAMRKKTVSFSKLPNESSVKDAADCVNRMQEGHQFVKMRSNSRVYNRLYWLEAELNCLRWEPSKKDSGKARIDITQVREVRPGKTTELFLSSDISAHFPDECSFSIIHGDGKTLDLIANSADDANVWITGLRCLMSGQDMEGLKMRSDARDSWLASVFDGADLNHDGFLDEEESFALLRSLSGGIRELQIKQKLQEYLHLKVDDKARLSKEDFIEIFKDVATRPEVYFLLARYATSDDRLSMDDLLNFLESEQGIANVTKEECLKLIEAFEPSEVLRSIPALGIDGFTKYLISDHCSIFDPKHYKVCQDMTQPLSHYYIASSHNTYLMEDQLTGPTDVSAYIRALLRCCRCVELDCWDGPNGEPLVAHGHTRTNPLPFRKVIEAINENAFRNSDYPVILCVENHCSKEQQLLMASCLKQLLGDKLYTDALAKEETQLPSPEALKRRFLIRSKKLSSDCCDDIGYISDDDEGREVTEAVHPAVMVPHDPTPRITNHAERRQVLVRELSDLVSICVAVTFADDFTIHQRSYSCIHTSSIHEGNALKLVENSPEEFISHNKKYLTRVYPSGLRIDSSNFNPQDFWNCGVQIASLNYQTPGLMMDISDGKFSMNGGCGYVLKPAILRDPLAYFNFNMRDTIPGAAPKILHLRIVSGQNFPKPRGGGAKGQVIDPYVLIELFGVPNDCSEHRTRTAANNSGGSPIFDEPFEFRLSLPSLALVRFVVLDDDFIGDEFIGQFTIPFECLRPGYRHLRLRSIFDEPLDKAFLFVHIAIFDADVASGSMGNITPVQSVNNKVPGKRTNPQKKTRKSRSRKDSDVIQIYDVNQPAVDNIFRGAVEQLQLSSMLRDSQRWSLAYFCEVCGVTPLASIKQCVRALSHRRRTDASFTDAVLTARQKRKFSTPVEPKATDDATTTERRRRASSTDAEKTRLHRQTSDTSQSSSDSTTIAPTHVRMTRDGRKVSLQLRGQSSMSESWRRVTQALDTLIHDSIALLDKAMNCSNALSSVYEEAAQLYEDLPKLLSNGNYVATDTGDITNTSNGSQNKKLSKSKKKQSFSLELDRQNRHSSDENFRWNCSVIKGQRDQLMTSRADTERMLTELWDAAVQYGLADIPSADADQKSGLGLNGLEPKSTNENANNNKRHVSPQLCGVSKVTGATGIRPSTEFPKSGPKLPQRSISSDTLPVTVL